MLGIFLDLETTGLDPSKHRVIDLAFKVVDLSSGETKGAYQCVVAQPEERWAERDPSSIQINGFHWDLVQTGKPEQTVGKEVIALLESLSVKRSKAVFICQNPSFDRGFFAQIVNPYRQEELQWPYHWLDFASMYWVIKLKEFQSLGQEVPEEFKLSKDAIAEQYDLPPEQKPHRAMNGVEHLLTCYGAVVGWIPSASPQR